ncbi:Gfo/Idh/MocA family oxidoreductase [Aliarcobacter cryaerophilus]|uniref:Gfo/Idh/MocA family oxidoreductase n=1 Tax=Aliarcobacter cryaerophilus TaxID=28198 RepID=UPI0021B1844B|nr:Gfo/Idh/MocA family oxidoreductase [Aliarcobacter cryaerophilus]MCT7463271.1 Gfo/Idh/MocA family oxidoreductase [Aliarcobacter cryaerophilus]
MIKIGIIGLSEGNGHPYSFSSIINGYDDEYMSQSGWDNIYMYLKERDISDFGIQDSKITHVWTQDIEESKKIAKASKIEHVVEKYDDMIEHVDAVIIARDDYESHKIIAKPFLDGGKYVFIDKPLSLDIDDLIYFKQFIKSGQLMSCSGIKYAPELDKIKRDLKDFGKIKLIRGTTVKSWEKYAIHMLDGIFSVVPFHVKSVQYNNSNHESFTLFNFDGSIIQIDALGSCELMLRIEFFSDTKYYKADTLNAFDAFRRTLWNFIDTIKNKEKTNSLLTLDLMKVLIAGNMSKASNKIIQLDSLGV